jgi:DNA polymerase eta
MSNRVIIHIDLDAFFAQVEQVRLGYDRSIPLVVVQWNSLVAVNYKAREFGITRFDTLEDSKKKCEDLVSVHVPTLTKDDPVPRYRNEVDYSKQKISLKPYRDASEQIMSIVGSMFKCYEVASVDEVYLDVTEMVEDMIEKDGRKDDPNPQVHWGDALMVGEPVTISYGQDDLRLRYALEISTKIRGKITETLGYTCSAGIGHNKTLAKLVSAMNKPNKQTVIRSASVMDFMATVPFKKIRGLGGKFGENIVSDLDIKNASDVWCGSINSKGIFFGTAPRKVWTRRRHLDLRCIQG